MKSKKEILFDKIILRKYSKEELREINSLLNSDEEDADLNSFFYKEWINKLPRRKFDIKTSYKKIIDQLELSPTQLQQDQKNFNKVIQETGIKKFNFTNVLKYAAIIAIASLSTYFLLKILPDTQPQMEEQFNKYSTPLGSRSSIELLDGTKIWLNSGSTLNIPQDFNVDNKKVFISGEAYFEVAKSENRPFYVITEGPDIKVLGTKFNVKAFPNEESIVTSLFEGKIKIMHKKTDNSEAWEYDLKPMQVAKYMKASEKISISFMDSDPPESSAEKITPKQKVSEIENIVYWKDGNLVFENETLEEISYKLHRWYGMNVIIEDNELRKSRYTGVFRNNETIFQVLDAFCLTQPLSYSISGNNLVIYKKTK